MFKSKRYNDETLKHLQQVQMKILKYFIEVCEENNLTYFIYGGSLLGTIRHKGFIPWDDDIDITMPREHWNKIMSLLKDDIEKYGITLRYDANIHPLRCLIIGYAEEKTGVWIDIFPDDSFRTGATEAQLIEAMKEYRFFLNHHKNIDTEALITKKDDIIGKLPEGDVRYMMSLWEGWMGEPYIINKPSDIYPLHRCKFEDFDFCVPNNIQLLLERRYGEKYLEIPRFAINNHGKVSDTSIAQRAKANGIDMEEVYRHLKSVYDSL